MNMSRISLLFYSLALLLIANTSAHAAPEKKLTRISGIVRDSITKEPLPFVSIVFVGKNIGTTTDYKGYYQIVTQWGSNEILASFLGYKQKTKYIQVGKRQTVDFELAPNNFSLKEVTVKAKRKRYRNKNNPSVDFIRKVIANKYKNRSESLDYYEYDKYEKIEFDLNNITEDFKNKKSLDKFQFIFNYIDTSLINNKPYLPVFLKETKSKVYFRKSPETKKEYVSGTNMVGFDNYIDDQGIAHLIDDMYRDINIYDNNIAFMTHEFISPLSDIGPVIYKYFILDTLDVNGYNCVRIGFQPRNKGDFSFRGEMFITNDERYSVIKIKMNVSDQINLNFVTDIQIDQEFDFINNKAWMLVKDDLVVDFNLTRKGLGLFGRKKNTYKDYVFNEARESSLYHSIQKVVKAQDHDNRSEDFWVKARHNKLSEKEKGIFVMVDSIQRIPAFKRTMDILVLALSGYWDVGPISIGNVSTFYAFNDIEGFKGRFGFETNRKFSELFMLESYLGYGARDKRFKYALGLSYSFTGNHFFENPRHYVKAIIQKETLFPGMEMTFINEDNFLLSFKRAVADKIMYYFKKDLEYNYDLGNGLTFNFHLNHTENEAGAVTYPDGRKSWSFEFKDGNVMDKIIRSEFQASLRIAPNEQYIQGRNYRVPIYNKHIVTRINYVHGFKNVFGSDFSYDKLSVNLFKRFYVAPFGELDIEIEGGKLFGEVPLPLLFIMRANQTYSYQINTYNMMNFMEFVADRYASVRVEHFFNGFFFNKIPLLKRLKLREVVTFKGVIGDLSDKNNPNAEINQNSMLFPRDIDGVMTSYSLERGPYIEVSAGVANIFKFFRIDLVRRLTYLDNPNVAKYGLRFRFRFHF